MRQDYTVFKFLQPDGADDALDGLVAVPDRKAQFVYVDTFLRVLL